MTASPTRARAATTATPSPGDGCRPNCTLEACGDGILDPSEGCDDGDTEPGDGCRADCAPELCGDGILDGGEQCDDGNTTAGDGCSAECRVETCGNGAVDKGESCDDGNPDTSDGCRPDCTLEVCGDGILDSGLEECDDGNTDPGDGCDATCEFEGVLAPPDGDHPLTIPVDSAASVTDFVSFPGGDTQDRVPFSVTGLNPNPVLPGGRARLVISASCFGIGTQNVQFFIGGQIFSCGQTLVDREVTSDSRTGRVTTTAIGGTNTFVQWVLTGTATRLN